MNNLIVNACAACVRTGALLLCAEYIFLSFNACLMRLWYVVVGAGLGFQYSGHILNDGSGILG